MVELTGQDEWEGGQQTAGKWTRCGRSFVDATVESARRVLVAFVVELEFLLLTSTTRSSVHDFGGWGVYADLVCTMVSIWDVGTLVSSKNVLLHVVFGSLRRQPPGPVLFRGHLFHIVLFTVSTNGKHEGM